VTVGAILAAFFGPSGPVRDLGRGAGSGIAVAATAPTASESTLLLIALLLAATALAILARRLGIPYPILLVLGGLAIGFIPHLPPVELEPDIVFLLFLPPILFSAGYFTSIRDLRANLRPILLLAVGLVLFTTAVVGAVTKLLVPDMPWAAALALGAIVAPPDAVAATAVFQRLGAPRRVVTILEGESLLNDATALVAYRFAVIAGTVGGFSLIDAGSTLVVASLGGIMLGLAIGAVTAWAVERVNDPVFSIVLTFLAPLVAYLAATDFPLFPLSGVLSTVAAGVFLGRKAPRLLSSEVRVSGLAAWQILLFLVNGSVFILIGLQLPTVLAGLEAYSPGQLLGLAVAVSAATILARIVWVFPATYLPRRLSARIRERDPAPPPRSVALIAWAGMRGVVSLAAALALPLSFPDRNLVIFLTFAVILATLVGQGLTLPFLIRRLGIEDGAGVAGQEAAYAELVAADAAIARLDQLAAEWPDHLPLIDRLREQSADRTRHARIRKNPEDRDEAAEQELIEHREIRAAVLDAEREAILNLRERGAISDDVYRVVERDLDLEELRMEV
jgi:CPA1 family monovalent cation:H+ antiporter